MARSLLRDAAMSLPRRIVPGGLYRIDRRCILRQFLLRPDRMTNQVFLYCLAEAAKRHGIRVIHSVVESNHHHTTVYDPHGKLCEFMEHLHKMVAKALNAYRGRWENFFAAVEPCVVQLFGAEDLLDALVYAATNPVKDGLVESVAEWPGVNTLSDLLERRTVTVERPTIFFRPNGCMPEEVEITFDIPEGLAGITDVPGFLDELRRRVAAVEASLAEERRLSGRRVLGRQGILRQSWEDSPSSQEPRRNLRPRVAAKELWRRVLALQRNQEFQIAYRAAREGWLAGLKVQFPAGTYYLHRFANVPVEPYDAAMDPLAILN